MVTSKIKFSNKYAVPLHEVDISAIRAQGAGGQNVNKVSSAIHLRFDINASSLADVYKQRLLALSDQRITADGVIVIKSQDSRSQEQNKAMAISRLEEMITSVLVIKRSRKPTKPSRAAKKKRLNNKDRRGKLKLLRQKVNSE